MLQLDELFRKRIQFPQNTPIIFALLETILEKMATTIPFENTGIIHDDNQELTLTGMIEKVLLREEGGLCYEINTLLYYFLKDNQFDVELVKAVVYDQTANEWSLTGNTHVVVILTDEDKKYILDAGFGLNVPMKPVPVCGDTICSNNGEFQIEATKEDYTYLFRMKRKYKDQDWNIGYKFFMNAAIQSMAELQEIKHIIKTSPHSAFNKTLLVAKLTATGSIMLTNEILRVIKNGDVIVKNIEEDYVEQVRKSYFGF